MPGCCRFMDCRRLLFVDLYRNMIHHVTSIQYGPEVQRLLADAELPTSDLDDGDEVQWVGMRIEGQLAGIAGLEIYGKVALVRSVVVTPSYRGHGFGKALVVSVENIALQSGVQEVYLLTETAEGYFERRGYRSHSREEAPPAIATTTEFAEVCPASAAFMRKCLLERPEGHKSGL